MKHENPASSAHVWTVRRGADGKLCREIDSALLKALDPALTPEELADLIETAEGEAEIARHRLW
jgi:hypothetical protein